MSEGDSLGISPGMRTLGISGDSGRWKTANASRGILNGYFGDGTAALSRGVGTALYVAPEVEKVRKEFEDAVKQRDTAGFKATDDVIGGADAAKTTTIQRDTTETATLSSKINRK